MGKTLEEIKRELEDRARGIQRKMYQGATIKFDELIELDVVATEKATGVPKYKATDVISVRYPGADETVVKVNEQHIKEYPEQWAAYKSNNEQPLEGMPLSQWTIIPRAVVEEFKYFGIRTVEQLRDVSDEAKRKIGPLQSWVKKAKEWDKAANSTQAQVASLTAQLERATKRADALEDKMAMLMQRIDATEGNNFSESFRSNI